jgi:hypothetical protein
VCADSESTSRVTANTDGGILVRVQNTAGHNQMFQDIAAANERNIAQLTLGGGVRQRESEPNICMSTKLSNVWLNILLVVVFQQCKVDAVA